MKSEYERLNIINYFRKFVMNSQRNFY